MLLIFREREGEDLRMMSSFALDSLRLTPLVGFDNYSTSMNRRNTGLASRIKARAPAKESTLPEY